MSSVTDLRHEHELDAWLVLAHQPWLDAPVLERLLSTFGGVNEVVGASVAHLRDAGLGGRWATRLVRYAADHPRRIALTRRWLEGDGCGLMVWGERGYPPLLREIADPPSVLFFEGDPRQLRRDQIAIVGSRTGSVTGREFTQALAADLTRAGLVVTSGLARGIDGAAHQGALAAPGETVAVLGAGIDRIYPRQHAGLALRIASQGCLISEFAPGVPPRPEHFPRRNRLISGLSLGVVVVEARSRSGSLITARLAAEQGREVFAVPGSVANPAVRGCHKLIREGAKLTEGMDDVLEELRRGGSEGCRPSSSPSPSAPTTERSVPGSGGPGSDPGMGRPAGTAVAPKLAHSGGGDSAPHWVLEGLEFEALDTDELVARTGLTAEVVSSILLRLELQGLVHRSSGAKYVRSLVTGNRVD